MKIWTKSEDLIQDEGQISPQSRVRSSIPRLYLETGTKLNYSGCGENSSFVKAPSKGEAVEKFDPNRNLSKTKRIQDCDIVVEQANIIHEHQSLRSRAVPESSCDTNKVSAFGAISHKSKLEKKRSLPKTGQNDCQDQYSHNPPTDSRRREHERKDPELPKGVSNRRNTPQRRPSAERDLKMKAVDLGIYSHQVRHSMGDRVSSM